ncbi:hypothetical protein RERY_39710 [Rhodococcus erythropolis]|nr:hypothetical protein RERY_39710 [Rhodococcus erythropolis]
MYKIYTEVDGVNLESVIESGWEAARKIFGETVRVYADQGMHSAKINDNEYRLQSKLHNVRIRLAVVK